MLSKSIKKIITSVILLLIPVETQSAMRSTNYIIYENVMHSFDGPVVSGVADSVSGNSATVIWSTDVVADSFVIYDIDSGFISSKEQGNSAKTNTSHSVTLNGLSYDTTYYYRVRSERVNGGITISPTMGSFTTGGDPATPSAPSSSSGGGTLIIDKTDKIAPEITEIRVLKVSESQAEITWKTNEESTSFVEYGFNTEYGDIRGDWRMVEDHIVNLNNLVSDKEYHYRVMSSDDWGNIATSSDYIFTLEGLEEVPGDPDDTIDPATSTTEIDEEDEESIFVRVRRETVDFLRRLFPEVALNDFNSDDLESINSLEDLENFVPMPILTGEPRVEIDSDKATFYWLTDSDSTSQVAVASDGQYDENSSEPYQQIVGDANTYVQEHEVTVYNLQPNTNYRYQLRSKGKIGPTAYSRDFSFTTLAEDLVISNYYTQMIDTETVIFKWVTNKNANSEVKFTPYHGEDLAFDESKIVRDNEETVIHELRIEDFQAGVFYDIEIASTDLNNNRATQVLKHFSTSAEDIAPIISHIKVDSTIFIDDSDRIQTVVSWLTNEPATTRVYFEEGVHTKTQLAEKTQMSSDYTKEHVIVIPKFKPGLVYSFRVESIDSGGNISTSKVHTFMTAKKRESIIQVILRILEDTFGWVRGFN